MMIELKPEVIHILQEVTPIIKDCIKQHTENDCWDTEELIESWIPSATPENPDPYTISCPQFTLGMLKKFIKAMDLMKIE